MCTYRPRNHLPHEIVQATSSEVARTRNAQVRFGREQDVNFVYFGEALGFPTKAGRRLSKPRRSRVDWK